MTKKESNNPEERSPQYGFMLRGDDEGRASRCPTCNGATLVRQFTLLIAVKDSEPILLGYRCRYCRACNLIVADESKFVALLASMLEQIDPGALDKEYFVLPAANLSSLPGDILQQPTRTETFERLARLEPCDGIERRPAGWYSGPTKK
ncbi:MAG: hypothetical protein L0229_14175 [Blastocatellia bacterium]|nr:hypothetical protein [Blastocatellia bacterium]